MTLKSLPKELSFKGKRVLVCERPARAREVAWPIVFLASDAASYITRARLPVEGGYLTAVELGQL